MYIFGRFCQTSWHLNEILSNTLDILSYNETVLSYIDTVLSNNRISFNADRNSLELVWQKIALDRKSQKITGWQNFKEQYISVKHRAISNKPSYSHWTLGGEKMFSMSWKAEFNNSVHGHLGLSRRSPKWPQTELIFRQLS